MATRLALGLRSSIGISFVVHLAVLLLLTVGGGIFGSRLPRITEITLVSGPGGSTETPGAGQVKVRPGGRQGTTAVAKGAVRGQVTVATPDFVPVGRKPRRSGDELMGTGAGEGGAPQGPASAGPGGGGAGRRIRYQEPLDYPDWAKQDGIDAKVVLRFKVNPDGTVDSQMNILATSGYRQLDELAMRTLRSYLFERLPHDAPQVAQWGELAFHFKPE